MKQRQMEYLHHGDALVPRQQRFSQYTHSLRKALDVPVNNIWGLRPAVVKGTKDIAPLTAFHDLDKLGLLKNVPTFNFHPHLPHYELTTNVNPLIPTVRTPSPQPATRSSTACSGCRQRTSEPETSCSWTRRTLPLSSAARRAWVISGGTSRR
jgi:hypothetical protein